MWNFVPQEEILKSNDLLDYSKPIIGFCPDWREKKDENGESVFQYMIELSASMRRYIEKSGAQMYIISYDMKIEDLDKILDGLIIPGGRDLNPKFYNQETQGANIEEDSLKRYPFMKEFYETMRKDIPVFAVCWGFQFLNVLYGGTLNQHISDS